MVTSTTLIIGAGPSGLATAACLEQRGISADLVDRHGVAGGAYQRIYPKIVLASPARYTQLPGYGYEIGGEYVDVAEYRDYLLRYSAHHELRVRQAVVKCVERAAGKFHVQFHSPAEAREYEAVVVATGMFDFPCWPAIDGLQKGDSQPLQVMHSSAWRGPEKLRGERVLIVGGATSAIEIAEECARAGLHPVLSVRRNKVNIFPQRFFGRDIHDYVTGALARLPRFVMKAYCQGRESLPGTDLGFRQFRERGVIAVRGTVSEIDGKTIRFAEGAPAEFDVLVAATGMRFAAPFLPAEVGRLADNGHPIADGCESPAWPRLFFVGLPCGRRLNSEFLYGIAMDAPFVAKQIAERSRKLAA